MPLDTGFLVHNDRTYPNLVRLFEELDVATRDSDMSFAVSCRRSGLEYSSRAVLQQHHLLFNEPWSEPATRPHAAGASESAV